MRHARIRIGTGTYSVAIVEVVIVARRAIGRVGRVRATVPLPATIHEAIQAKLVVPLTTGGLGTYLVARGSRKGGREGAPAVDRPKPIVWLRPMRIGLEARTACLTSGLM